MRLFIIACLIALTQFPAWKTRHDSNLQTVIATQFDMTALPVEIANWSGSDIQLDDDMLRQIGGASAVQRLYVDRDDNQASVFLASSSAADCLVPHQPTDCYSGAGWTILSNDWQSNESQHRYRLMRITRDHRAAFVLYWYQVGTDVISTREELRQVLQSRRWNRQEIQPLVKVMIHCPVAQVTDLRPAKGVEDLAVAIYEWVNSK